jgi:polar amino acid transport system substrate-binding protein
MRTLLLVVPLLFLAACGEAKTYDSTLDKVLDTGELVIGTEPEFKPFESKDEHGNYVGFDMDLVRELAKDLGVELRIEEMAFPALIPALKTRKIDLVISGMTATEERAEEVAFSDSYFQTGLCLLVHHESGIEKPEDADGKRIVVKQGTTGQINAPKLFPESVDSITVMQTEGECATEVALGRADAFLYDQLSVLGASKKHAKTTRPVLTPLTHEPYAMAVRHGDTKMVERLNEFLATIRADGRYQELRDTYLGELPDGSK